MDRFLHDPQHEGPTFLGARLDTSATTLQDMKTSAWNQAIIHLLVQESELVVADLDQLSNIDIPWGQIFSSHIHGLLRDAYEAKPRPDEDTQRAAFRMSEKYGNKKKKNALRSLLARVRFSVSFLPKHLIFIIIEIHFKDTDSCDSVGTSPL